MLSITIFLKGLKKVFKKLFGNRSEKNVTQTFLKRFDKTYSYMVVTRFFKMVSGTYLIKILKTIFSEWF